MPKDKVIIANCSGFWGDDPTAAQRQVDGGAVGLSSHGLSSGDHHGDYAKAASA